MVAALVTITIMTREKESVRGLMEGIMQLSYDTAVKLMLSALERNLLPDAITRRLTRLLLATRLRSGYKTSSQLQLSQLISFVHCILSSSLSYLISSQICVSFFRSLNLKMNFVSDALSFSFTRNAHSDKH